MAKTKRVKEALPDFSKDRIKDVYLDEQSNKDYYLYGTSTIEDRAIVGVYDGLKPVLRRVMYAMNTLGLNHKAVTVKAALIVGETMGKYHPHGDASIFEAAVKASQACQPLIDGSDSNWGTMLSSSGAMRYINGRLTKYADRVFFDPFYLPTMVLSPNYDGSRKEPVNLVTLLPNGLINGNFGICPGVNTRTPAFTLKSVVKVLQNMIENKGKCDVKMCKDLVWISAYGGHVERTSYNLKAMKEFFRTGVAQIDWSSTLDYDASQHAIRITKFAPRSFNEKATADKASVLETLLTTVEELSGVQSIDSDGEANDPYQVAYLIRFKKSCKGKDLEKVTKQIAKLFSERERMDVKVTDRVFKEEEDIVDIKLKSTTVPKILEQWLEYRINLEKSACSYWKEKRQEEIAYLNLMRLAISQLDFIFKCVRDTKLDDAALVKKISKGLKITPEQTNQILARNLRQLRHLEDKKLVEKIKDLKAEVAGYEARIKKPSKYISKHLEEMAAELSVVTRKVKAKKGKK